MRLAPSRVPRPVRAAGRTVADAWAAVARRIRMARRSERMAMDVGR
jgi:hypothetical protein